MILRFPFAELLMILKWWHYTTYAPRLQVLSTQQLPLQEYSALRSSIDWIGLKIAPSELFEGFAPRSGLCIFLHHLSVGSIWHS
jgi:hypothetical protein